MTFYHRNGKCYYRKRSHYRYPGAAAQTSALDVHRCVPAAWREVPHQVQLEWHRLGGDVEPQKFPPFSVGLGDAVKMGDSLVIPAKVELGGCQDASRFRLLAKIQITAPGRCRHLGLLRNYLAEGDCGAGVVSIVIPGYIEQFGFELNQFQVYARFILLLDSVTGYRGQYQENAFVIKAL